MAARSSTPRASPTAQIRCHTSGDHTAAWGYSKKSIPPVLIMLPSIPKVYGSWGKVIMAGPTLNEKGGSVGRIQVSPGRSTVNNTTSSATAHKATSHQRERRSVTAAHADKAVIGSNASDLSKETRSQDSRNMNLALRCAAWTAPWLS